MCFAVKEEAEPFNQIRPAGPQIQTLLTGIGRRNAERAIRAALAAVRPKLVLSCGFAGGLQPELATGTVVFAAEEEAALAAALAAAGARPVRFHGAERVAATAEEKRALWQATGAEAVEMESQIIREVCREQKIPSAVVRVILDTAAEDLPLDFNRVMTPEQEMDYGKLTKALLRSPGAIKGLLRLQRQSKAAAQKLAQVLMRVLA